MRKDDKCPLWGGGVVLPSGDIQRDFQTLIADGNPCGPRSYVSIVKHTWS